MATAPQIPETAEARSHEALLEQADLKVESDRPGHVNRTFAWHEKQGRDESGDVPVIVQKEEEETEGENSSAPRRSKFGFGGMIRAYKKVHWVANKSFEISKFKFKFPRARTYEIIGLVLGCIEAKFCK